VIDKKVAASGLPSSKNQLVWLRKHGVDSILTLTETPLPAEWLTAAGVMGKHVQMFDHAPPTSQSLSEAVAFIASQMGKEQSVLVHCQAGIGRTGSVLAAYLIQYEGMTSDEALAHLRGLRPRSVETAQEPAVHEFASGLKRAKKEQGRATRNP
jgi:atypical dual specificity phosphatase